MKEGTVPVPSYDPCANSDGDVLPVQGYCIREATAAGVTPHERYNKNYQKISMVRI